ncbi:type II secretion system major pseudopilin GspG [bacterium]|jgi:general secretion pathway protein G|nr:type II secretion system major pseudopilin GspG [bacterium]
MIRKSALKPGLTLIEMVVVLMIIGIFAAIAVPSYFKFVSIVQERKATSDLKMLSTSVKTYHLTMMRWPDKLENLVEAPADENLRRKWGKGGFLEGDELPIDPWDHSYEYEKVHGEAKPYKIWSYGSGGEDAPEEDWIYAK